MNIISTNRPPSNPRTGTRGGYFMINFDRLRGPRGRQRGQYRALRRSRGPVPTQTALGHVTYPCGGSHSRCNPFPDRAWPDAGRTLTCRAASRTRPTTSAPAENGLRTARRATQRRQGVEPEGFLETLLGRPLQAG